MKNERVKGSSKQIDMANEAIRACGDLFDSIIQIGKENNQPGMEEVVSAFTSGENNIRVALDYDFNGIVTIKFHSLKGGEESELLFDLLPGNKLNS